MDGQEGEVEAALGARGQKEEGEGKTVTLPGVVVADDFGRPGLPPGPGLPPTSSPEASEALKSQSSKGKGRLVRHVSQTRLIAQHLRGLKVRR